MLELGRALVLATGVGLNMDVAELDNLLSLVDESFWVMRYKVVVANGLVLPNLTPGLNRCIGYPPLPDSHDGVSCGAHKE